MERGTDLLNADTDGDGLIDSLEEEFGFDPLNPDTAGNGILDGDEVVTYTTKTGEIELDPYNKIISNQYDDLVINYSIEGDFLQSWFVDKAVATKFGKIVSPYSHLKSSESSHALIQFYDHFPNHDNYR